MAKPQPASPAPSAERPDPERVPRHIAIVMDGNGRWAEQRGRPRSMGHQAGLKALRRVIQRCGQLAVPELTIFAFSSENWNRPRGEVSRLMDLFMRSLEKETRELQENDIRLKFIGDLSAFNTSLRDNIEAALQATAGNQRMRLNVAVNYGGRWDITQAARQAAEACMRGEMTAEQITEDSLGSFTALADRPDPDLFIRTGGEIRISNFLLWQSAYTEFFFSPVLWPDFGPAELDQAIAEFRSRERRFGRTGRSRRLAG